MSWGSLWDSCIQPLKTENKTIWNTSVCLSRLQMSNVNMEATTILPVLKKKLAFLSGKTNTHYNICTGGGLQLFAQWSDVFPSVILHRSGGKDRRSGLILNIPLSSDQTSMEELSATLDYLLSIPRYAATKMMQHLDTVFLFLFIFFHLVFCF